MLDSRSGFAIFFKAFVVLLVDALPGVSVFVFGSDSVSVSISLSLSLSVCLSACLFSELSQ